ncbi:alpha/beta hydrolase [Mucilaginibacter daejeonensis]|uniref:alpha/beta hydrolase n=1 Tax=Mucilaginibacter daejeonensis TaxID=398049 RepID=UPI001D17715E|nr:alpha/beta hydrolase [Mucilaginibacter daejeonensis]UEG52770.1 alpha/beta hydrolase [Mucilaginibacter daejeonensis]
MLPALASAQTITGIRYKDHVFAKVTELKDQRYDNGQDKKDKAHLFDLYTPEGDTHTGRPLIIWMHGGGFKFGSKDAKGVELWSRDFAQRGYVAVSLNYTLSKKFPIFNFDELLRSAYFAVQDLHEAVAYFKKNHTRYGIDPDQIFLAGNSAGGMIALQAAFVSNATLAKFVNLPDTVAGAKITTIPKAAGVINFWGGIFDLNWLKNSRTPVFTVHGSTDGTLSPTHKDAPLYGSIDIHQKADEIGLPNGIKIFEGYSHELQKHFNPVFGVGKGTKQRWMEASDLAAKFMYQQVLSKK